MITTVVGFDIRIIDRELFAAEWGVTRRDDYLLRSDVGWVASADTVVWPSVFDFNEWAQGDRKYPPIRMMPQDARQQAFGLWRDLRSMLAAFSTRRGSANLTVMPVAVCLIDGHTPGPEPPWVEVSSGPTSPAAIEDSWRLLGFDVADRFLMSGLSNSAYSRVEKDMLSATWSTKLNDTGLIKDLEDATTFRGLSDQRVQEHSPFLIFGLYEVDAGLATC